MIVLNMRQDGPSVRPQAILHFDWNQTIECPSHSLAKDDSNWVYRQVTSEITAFGKA